MRLGLPAHRLSLDPSDEWLADEMAPKTQELHGLCLRSSKHGVYFNVRAQGAGLHPLTRDGLLAFLREQSWASAPFDEWVTTSGPLTLVGGTFETVAVHPLQTRPADDGAVARAATRGGRVHI